MAIKHTTAFLLLIGMGYMTMSYSYGPTSSSGDRTGSPLSSGTCATGSGCHTSVGSFTPTTTVQLLNGTTPVTSYTPSTTYTVRITISSSTGVTSSTRYGFQIVSLQSSTNAAVNAWGTPPTGTHSATFSGKNYIEHTTQLSSNIINIPWTAPATTTGNITFYCMGNVVNNNFSETGDNCIAGSLTVVPASSGCVAPALSTTTTNVVCKGDSTGGITLNTTGGSSPFIFAWTGPGGYAATTQNITGIPAGTYNVTVTATGGCTATTSALITEPSTRVTTSTSSNTPLCAGATLNLGSTTSSGTPGYTYSWTGPAGFTSTNSSAILTNVTTAMSGKYILTARDINGCTAKDTENVTITAKPVADSFMANPASNLKYNFIIINPLYAAHYSWDFGDGSTDTVQTPTHSYSGTGSYTIRVILSNSCGNDTLTKQIYVVKSGVAKGKWQESISIYPNPARNSININTGAQIEPISATMFNLSGIRVKSVRLSTNNRTINTSDVPTGTYLLQIETSSGSVMQTVIIR